MELGGAERSLLLEKLLAMPGKVSPSSEEQERGDALKPLKTPGPLPTEAPSS